MKKLFVLAFVLLSTTSGWANSNVKDCSKSPNFSLLSSKQTVYKTNSSGSVGADQTSESGQKTRK